MTFMIKAAPDFSDKPERDSAENMQRSPAVSAATESPAESEVTESKSGSSHERESSRRVAVVGGGPAGMRAAAAAARAGADVTLFEKNKILGRKLRITGKGRCNLTNDCPVDEFMAGIPANSRFLWSSLSRLSPEGTKQLFESLGVPLKTERGRRVFPVSDRAGDVAGAMVKDCHDAGVKVVNERVTSLLIDGGRINGLVTDKREYSFDAVILCTGGLSYPLTGSDGDGYRFAAAAGHKITKPVPSLVPIECEGSVCRELQGLSLKNVALKIINIKSGKTVYEDFGEMMFTHFGITGPMVLSASAHLRDMAPGIYEARIDLKPALDHQKLDTRLLSDFKKYSNRIYENALSDLLPSKMIPVVVALSGIDPEKRVNSITREERASLAALLKGFPLKLTHFRPIDEAIITRGGVDVREIRPGSMESKLVEGLFFAGEIIDVDGYTGGYNLQIAFSTGTLAGESAAGVTKK